MPKDPPDLSMPTSRGYAVSGHLDAVRTIVASIEAGLERRRRWPQRAAIMGASAAVVACGAAASQRSTSDDGDAGGVVVDAGARAPDSGDSGRSPVDAGHDATTPDGGDAGASTSDGGASDGGDSGPTGPVYPEPGQTTGPGVLPPATASVTYEGTLVYDNPAVVRDLGFSGVVNGQIIWTFGDTLLLQNGGATLTASDSAGLGDLKNPTHVHDKNLDSNGGPQQWIPLTAAEQANGGLGRYAEGGTNVVEYAPNKGLVWFLKNDRGSNGAGIVGAGVATVTADASGPRATRTDDTMWSSVEPYWGDIGVTYDALDQNVYVFGHGPSSANLGDNVYLARVPAVRAMDVGAYQYWDQSQGAWTSTRLANGQLGTISVSSAQAIFTNKSLGQSNAFWSNYYNTWMFVYGADVGYTDIMVMTSPKLEGPWTKGVTIGSTCPNNKCSAIRYAIAPHPEFDLSGKTLLVTWTDSNTIYAVRIGWQ